MGGESKNGARKGDAKKKKQNRRKPAGATRLYWGGQHDESPAGRTGKPTGQEEGREVHVGL